jgi:hypothetical protein
MTKQKMFDYDDVPACGTASAAIKATKLAKVLEKEIDRRVQQLPPVEVSLDFPPAWFEALNGPENTKAHRKALSEYQAVIKGAQTLQVTECVAEIYEEAGIDVPNIRFG